MPQSRQAPSQGVHIHLQQENGLPECHYAEDFIRNRKHIPVVALRTLHAPQQATDTPHPLVLAARRISLLAGLGIVKASSKYITPPAKQRTEQLHLLVI